MRVKYYLVNASTMLTGGAQKLVIFIKMVFSIHPSADLLSENNRRKERRGCTEGRGLSGV